MINNSVIVGRLTKDVDLRYTSNGDAVGSFIVAVNRPFKNSNGENEADFINCVVWKKKAENLANFTRKGSLISVRGRIQTRNYENQQGTRVYVTEIVAEEIDYLDGKNTNEQQNPNQQSHSNHNQQPNRNAHQITDEPLLNSGHSIDISDDELPF